MLLSLRRLLAAICLLTLPAAAVAQNNPQAPVDLTPDRFAFSPGTTYDPAVPSPADFLGYELGTRYTFHAHLVDYLEALDEASDRVTMHEYGRTHEGRPLYYLVITTPSNQARIETIRENNLRLADPRGLSEAERDALIAEHPAVLWLSYNVHGNEGSSSETAMQVAYHLAAGQDAAVDEILENSVVILDPVINPDGRDRYVYWYTSMQSPVVNADPIDLEHDEPWPGGRTNHYWFDLNRDWVWLVHPESQGRIAAYQQWMPQIHVDYHEQGFNNNYFTVPGTTPRNLNLPDDYDTWADLFGRANAAAFDDNQIMYGTREAFDFFYPGYGSSYPSVMGAIGMLTEQGGHSRGGTAVETDDGYMLTLRQRVFDHYLTSLATLEAGVDNREALLRYFVDAMSPVTNESNTAAYLIRDDDTDFTYDVVDMLLKHGVEVHRADESFTVRQAYSYVDGAATEQAFDAGTFVVYTDQPRHLFINTILQRQMAIEDSVMYDMSAWSAPLAYNLDTAWTTTRPGVDATRLSESPQVPHGVVNPNAQVAYAIDWNQRHAPKALAHLWKRGYRVRSAFEPFTIDGTTFERGTILVLAGRNQERADRMAADMQAIAEAAQVQIVGLDRGRMDEGIDLGSRSSEALASPRVALMVDSPFSSYTAGQLWFLLSHETDLNISRLRTDVLPDADLTAYDVLILPGAYGLSSALDSTQVERLQRWVRGGGTLVATENSALFFTEDASGFTDVAQLQEPEADEEEDEAPALVAYTRYDAREDTLGLRRIPGAALLGRLDVSHPLAFGLPETVYTLKQSDEALVPSESFHTVGYYAEAAEDLLVSGYASQENLQKLAGHTFAGVQPMGDGQVVFLVDNTQYRAFWVGPSRLLLNAVMQVPGM